MSQTATAKFIRCHNVTKVWEGGWSNHPADPGGKTMYGVTQAVYDEDRKSRKLPPKPVRNITMTEALDIYYRRYWKPVNGDTLFPGVDLAVYDAGVNSGVSRGRKWLLASLGSDDHTKTVKRICAKRLGFVRALTTFRVFGKGWSNRIADVEAKGVAWAAAAMVKAGVTPSAALRKGVSADASSRSVSDAFVVHATLEEEAFNAEQSEIANKAGAGGTAATGTAGGGGATQIDASQLPEWALWGGVGVAVALVLLFVYLMYRARINRQRAEAYAVEARKADTYVA